MAIDWGALGTVVVVSIGVGVGVVLVFAVGVLALAQRRAARVRGRGGVVPTVGAVSCFAACALAVLYGLYLVVWTQLSQLFH